MDLEELQRRLSELRAAMLEKAVSMPDPNATFAADRCHIYLGLEVPGGFEAFHHGNTIEDCFISAHAEVSRMPTPEEAGNYRYRKALADALDVGREESIEDEFTAPVRTAMNTFTERALPNYAET